MALQRYISPELTHFVGRALSVDEQYSALVHGISKTGWLKPSKDIRNPEEVLQTGRVMWSSWPQVDTDAITAHVVCFCDILVTDLEIHMNKYSRFGLSFLKPFLIGKGANPVLYVVNDSPALSFGLFEYLGLGKDGPSPRRTVFPELHLQFHQVL